MGYYMHNGKTIGALHVAQQLKRPRDSAFLPPQQTQPWDYYIYCCKTVHSTDDHFKKFPKQISDIENKLQQLDHSMQSTLSTGEIISIDSTGATSIRKEPIAELYLQFIRNRNLSRGQLKTTLHYMFELNGHSVHHLCPSCSMKFSSTPNMKEHLELHHPQHRNDWNDSILNSDSEQFTKAELWNNECKDYADLFYNPKDDQDLISSIKKRFLEQRDERTREWLNIPQDVDIPQDSILYPIMFDEKSQQAYQKFKLLCCLDQHVQISAAEDRYIHITQNEQTILNILHLIESDILKCKRLDCLFWEEIKVRSLVDKNIKQLNLNNLLRDMQHFELGENFKTIHTMHDAYKFVCKCYQRFLQSVTDEGSSRTLIKTEKYKVNLKVPKNKLKRAKSPQRTCEYCNKPKYPKDFYCKRGKGECKQCMKKKFNIYRLKPHSNQTISHFIEIITSQPNYKPENYQLMQDSFQSFIANCNRVYANVWELPHSNLEQLVSKSISLFTTKNE